MEINLWINIQFWIGEERTYISLVRSMVKLWKKCSWSILVERAYMCVGEIASYIHREWIMKIACTHFKSNLSHVLHNSSQYSLYRLQDPDNVQMTNVNHNVCSLVLTSINVKMFWLKLDPIRHWLIIIQYKINYRLEIWF